MNFAQGDGVLTLRLGVAGDAPAVLDVVLRSFHARPPLDPPAEALSETEDSIRRRIVDQLCLIAAVDDQPAAALFISSADGVAMLHRVGVLPEHRAAGLAGELIRAALQLAADRGDHTVRLIARQELPKVVQWWEEMGFRKVEEVPHGYLMERPLPIRVEVPSADRMQQLAARLATVLRAGDLIIAAGELGAGKTTFAQGLGAGLGVQGQIASPTFVLSRIHEGQPDRPGLVHVDAYRLGSAAELADLDLETSMANSVTLVEWGEGLAEQLSADRLELEIHRSADPCDETRVVYLDAIGERWDEQTRQQLNKEFSNG